MPYRTTLCVLNAKYIHSSLAPWCLLAGMQTYAPRLAALAVVAEGTINEPPCAVQTRILATQPSAVGFSCYIWNIRQTLALAAQLKAALPQLTVILGGPEVSYNAADVLAQNPQVDYILAGEGERSLPALLACLASGQRPCVDMHSVFYFHNNPDCNFFSDAKDTGAKDTATSTPILIHGLCTRAGCSAPCVGPGEPPSPYSPAYLAALHGRIAYLETSRGCPYSCAFCLSGRCGKPRWFSLAQAKQNLLTLANSGARTVKLIDRTFNANPAHANALLAFLLAQYGAPGGIPPGVCFHFEIAADILQADTLALLQQAPAGAFQLEIGMQSFHAPTLCAIRRATDVEQLQKNIRKLVQAGNAHIHIDLIAGLPFEDLGTFAHSFDTAYALGAQMLQLGFLKLLHGASMREEPETFPCEFSALPPYEVTRTPWLSAEDLTLLRAAEDALERVYNSGRFLRTAAYVLQAAQAPAGEGDKGFTPFAFYCTLGLAARTYFSFSADASDAARISLDAYTAFLFVTCAALQGIDKTLLRDAMVCDRLATNATGRLPACLQVRDVALAKAVKRLAACPDTAPLPGVRRGVALLYGARKICWVDYTAPHPVTGQYPLQILSL